MPSPELQTIPVSGADGVWLQDLPENLMVINAVYTIDRITAEEFRPLWMERLMGEPGAYRFPRFARRIVQKGGRPHWQDDPNFDITQHIFNVPELPGGPPNTKEKLQDYVGSLANKPLPPDRSPWQVHVIPEFGGDGSALVVRIHHVMGDGIGLIGVLFALMDSRPKGEQDVVPAVIDRGGKPPNKAMLALTAALAGPAILLRKALWRRDNSVMRGPKLGGEKKVAWTTPMPVDRLKAVKNHYGTTLNDVLVSCVAGAFRRYALDRGDRPMEQLQVTMPVNMRSASEEPTMDNKFAAVMLSLPVSVDDPVERLTETKQRLDALKRSVEPFSTYGVVKVTLAALPFAASRMLLDFYANKCSCVLSNVPGPQAPLHLGGRRIRAMLFWVPQRADIGIGVSILSFAGELRLGILADTVLVPEPTDLVDAFVEELELLERGMG